MAKLVALEVAFDIIRELKRVLPKIEQRDRKLGDEGRRAATSIVLNLGEGSRRIGRDRLHAFRIAFGSADELEKVVRIALAWGYIDEEPTLSALLDRQLRLLHGLTRARGSSATT
jgi:four helix bundle protein